MTAVPDWKVNDKKGFTDWSNGFVGRQVVRAFWKTCGFVLWFVRQNRRTDLLGNSWICHFQDLFAESSQWWEEQWRCWYRSASCLVYGAGKVPTVIKNMDCLVGSLSLAQGAVQAVKRFVSVGTCFEYDLTPGVLSMDTPLKPITPYAGAKAALYFGLDHWLQTIRLNSHGADFFTSMVKAKTLVGWYPICGLGWRKEAYRINQQQTDPWFSWWADAGRMIVDVALSNQTGPVNICSGFPITVRQLAEQIADEYGRRDLLRFNVRKYEVDPPCIVGISI